MEPQVLKTTAGEELIVLPRRDYDVLLARLGDEDAEDRLLLAMAEEAMRNLASGKDILLPVWFSDGLMARRNPVRIVREHFAKTLAETAEAAGIAEERLRAIEAGEEQPPNAVLDAISASVGLDPRVLSGMYADEPAPAA